MNVSIVYRRCQQVAIAMVEDGFSTVDVVRWDDIEHYVARFCGADPRTLDKYRRYLVYFGFFTSPRSGLFQWCDRDKFNNPVKTAQTNMSLLKVLNPRKTPRRSY